MTTKLGHLPGTGTPTPYKTQPGTASRDLYSQFGEVPAQKAPEAAPLKCCCSLLHVAIGLTVLAVAAATLALLILFCPPVGSAVAAVMAHSVAAGLLGGLSFVSAVGAGVCYYLHCKQKTE